MSERPSYNDFLTPESKRRQPSAIRAMYPLMRKPGMVSLAAGLPNPETFPFECLTITLDSKCVVDGKNTLELSPAELRQGLQYSGTRGLDVLLRWIADTMSSYHSPPKQTEYCVTNGSQDGQAKAFDALVNSGDTILLEDPTYSGALAALRPKGAVLHPISMDEQGLSADALRDTLKNWGVNQSTKDLRFPRVLYTIPTGQNPSGRTQTAQRKREIYSLAVEYDLIILEDDPYYLLQLEDESEQVSVSYLSIDVYGRVLRFDSLSKVLSSGIRIGWVSGPPELVSRIELHQQVSAMHTSGLSQAVAAALLTSWGLEGFKKHLARVQKFYRDRRDFFLACLEKHIKPFATWEKPTAGMFVWLRLNSVDDSRTLIADKAPTRNVLCMPGQVFSANDCPGPFVRCSYSVISYDDMEIACERLRDLLAEC